MRTRSALKTIILSAQYTVENSAIGTSHTEVIRSSQDSVSDVIIDDPQKGPIETKRTECRHTRWQHRPVMKTLELSLNNYFPNSVQNTTTLRYDVMGVPVPTNEDGFDETKLLESIAEASAQARLDFDNNVANPFQDGLSLTFFTELHEAKVIAPSILSALQDLRAMQPHFSAAGLALTWSYAIRPLIADLREISVMSASIAANLKRIKKARATGYLAIEGNGRSRFEQAIPHPPPFTSHGVQDFWHQVKGLVKVKIHGSLPVEYAIGFTPDWDEHVAKYQALGFGAPASFVWDSIPFSFVVDYFTEWTSLLGRFGPYTTRVPLEVKLGRLVGVQTHVSRDVDFLRMAHVGGLTFSAPGQASHYLKIEEEVGSWNVHYYTRNHGMPSTYPALFQVPNSAQTGLIGALILALSRYPISRLKAQHAKYQRAASNLNARLRRFNERTKQADRRLLREIERASPEKHLMILRQRALQARMPGY